MVVEVAKDGKLVAINTNQICTVEPFGLDRTKVSMSNGEIIIVAELYDYILQKMNQRGGDAY